MLLLGLGTFALAQDTCPYGAKNDPAPWQCPLYVDQDQDQVCDLGQSDFVANTIIKRDAVLVTQDVNIFGDKNLIELLKWIRFAFLFVLIGFLTVMSFVHKKFKKFTKFFFQILCYVALPLLMAYLAFDVGIMSESWPKVFWLWRTLGYRGLWLLMIILYVSPLFKLLKQKKNVISKAVRSFSYFVMRWRREFGVAVFWLILGHGWMYLLYWADKWRPLFEFLDATTMWVGFVGFVALFIGRLTSNNYSIRKLGKRRKKIQLFAYLALLAGVVHIIFIVPEYVRVLGPVTLIYFVLKWVAVLKKW